MKIIIKIIALLVYIIVGMTITLHLRGIGGLMLLYGLITVGVGGGALAYILFDVFEN